MINAEFFQSISNIIFAKNYKVNSGRVCGLMSYLQEPILDGDTIFCKTDFIKYLFDMLSSLDVEVNLITHQSDTNITQKIFETKPPNIKKWFAVNVNYDHPDLIPIPWGVSDSISRKTILKSENFIHKPFEDREFGVYLNFDERTHESRLGVKDRFRGSEHFYVADHYDLGKYAEEMSRYKFVLCPRGNGICTHRVWESLYSGAVPIVESSTAYRGMGDLPIVFVDSICEISIDKLQHFDYNKFSFEKMSQKYWKDFINKV